MRCFAKMRICIEDVSRCHEDVKRYVLRVGRHRALNERKRSICTPIDTEIFCHKGIKRGYD